MTMKKLFGIAAILLAAAACTREEPEAIPQTVTPETVTDSGIPFSAKINGEVVTKALSEGNNRIVPTWAEDEEVALIYSDGTARKDVMRVTSVDGEGTATITGTLTGNPSGTVDVTVIYPATAADGTSGNVDYSVLYSQKGTLDDVAANCDIRKGTGSLAVTGGVASFTENISLENQCAIFKFTLKQTDGTTPIAAKPLVICFDAQDYTIDPENATDVLYAALPGLTNKAVSFTATNSSSVKFYKAFASVTFVAGKYFQSPLQMSSQLTLPGQFSVSATKKVAFSKGNLQWFYGDNGNMHKTALPADSTAMAESNYNGGVFMFADHQWRICGNENKMSNQRHPSLVANHITSCNTMYRFDLFMYASSGYRYNDTGNYVYKPFAVCNGHHYPDNQSSSPRYYGPFYEDIAGTYCDWGVFNAILNGGDEPGMWRTLTQPEWDYLMNSRTNATSKRGLATVANVRGIIILPDDWSGSGITATTNSVAKGNTDKPATMNWTDNVYTIDQWSAMEANGAVFLPAAGTQSQANYEDVHYYNVDDNNALSSYWTSSYVTNTYNLAYALDLGKEGSSNNNWRFDTSGRAWGRAVRLVRDVE